MNAKINIKTLSGWVAETKGQRNKIIMGGRRSGDSYISTVLSMPISLEEKKMLIQKYTDAVKESICMQLDFYMAMAGGSKK